MASPRTHLPPLHTRNISAITVESDSSDTSAVSFDDEETDHFMTLNNDSQSSLGAITIVHDDSTKADLEKAYRLTPISKLPPEILISIFVKLTTTADLKSCMLVSYHWALYAVGILWHRPLCNKWSNLFNVVTTLERRHRGYFHYCDMVKRLNLSALSDKISDGSVLPFMDCKGIERLTLTNCTKLTDYGVAGLVNGCKKLQALDVTDLRSLTDVTLSTVAQNCSKLQGLNITNCSNITDESLSQVADKCRQLKRLKLNRVNKITDESVTAVARNCRSILEIDLAECESISSDSVTALLSNLPHLRELRLAQCGNITDAAFVNLPPLMTFEALRILDLTACEQVRDEAIARIIPAAPRLRNLVLAKCRHITDRAVTSICKLTKNLHYIHLGHCVNLTDNAVIQLVKACNRIRYIDLACCLRLTDASVRHLAQLPKLRRIGLVKCQNLTDASIIALAHGPLLFSDGQMGIPSQFVSLERVHLSYCVNLTLKVSSLLVTFKCVTDNY
jgi:F-box and leucine-rich repeat protein GRR1